MYCGWDRVGTQRRGSGQIVIEKEGGDGERSGSKLYKTACFDGSVLPSLTNRRCVLYSREKGGILVQSLLEETSMASDLAASC